MLRGAPWVRLKIAASMDGRTALKSGLSQWITGEAARRDAHKLRAQSCALLTGVGTALQDNPRLTARGVRAGRQPLRVLVDSRRRLPADYRLFDDANVLVAAAAAGDTESESVVLDDGEGKVDLRGLMRYLAAAREVNEVTVEAGRKICGALLRAGLVDEIVLYLSPRIIGDSGKGMFDFMASEDALSRPADFALCDVDRFCDGDLKLTYQKN